MPPKEEQQEQLKNVVDETIRSYLDRLADNALFYEGLLRRFLREESPTPEEEATATQALNEIWSLLKRISALKDAADEGVLTPDKVPTRSELEKIKEKLMEIFPAERDENFFETLVIWPAEMVAGLLRTKEMTIDELPPLGEIGDIGGSEEEVFAKFAALKKAINKILR